MDLLEFRQGLRDAAGAHSGLASVAVTSHFAFDVTVAGSIRNKPTSVPLPVIKRRTLTRTISALSPP